jgi:hypothetical protein
MSWVSDYVVANVLIITVFLESDPSPEGEGHKLSTISEQ